MPHTPSIYRVIELYPADRRTSAPKARFMLANISGVKPSHQERRTACWYLLNHLLTYTSAARVNDWKLYHADSGAPRVTNNNKPSQLNVSMAHSADWLAVGVASEAGIGVDIEYLKPRDNMLAIADFLGWKVPIRDKRDFYTKWTLWEACAKCIEGSVLMTKNPGFEKLCDVDTPDQVGISGRWCELNGMLDEKLVYTIVLHCQNSTVLTYRILDPGKIEPW